MTELIWDGKYKDGKRVAPLRVSLPFQTVETVNESAQQRQTAMDLFSSGRDAEWRNRLIWGDKKYVLPSLLPEFAGKVNLVCIDPPFNVGADFSFTATIPDNPDTEEDETTSFTKQPSMIEQKAYRDTWGRGLDSYLQWFYETVVWLRELLTEDGSIYVHLDWHIGHYAKAICDEVFGQDNFLNEIVWWYYNKFQGNVNHFASNHDVIYLYRKSNKFTFHPQSEVRDKPVRQLKRAWDKEKGSIVNAKDEQGRVQYVESTHRTVDDIWRISMLQPADRTQNLFYPTQKPEALLERMIRASSIENDLVLDCFGGSGTVAAVAEKNNRRWIVCDLGRFAIHTTRKRLLSIDNVRPFVGQNLGKYERQLWQTVEFGEQAAARNNAYRQFILELYHAQPISGYSWLHGLKAGRMVHVGAVDSPVSPADVTQIAIEFKKAMGTGKDAPKTNGVDVLGWDFAFEMNEIAQAQAAQANLNVRFLKIPREVLEKKAVEQGDIKFFELAALSVKTKVSKRTLSLTLNDFIIPPDDVPEEVRRAISHWSQWIDYWAVDWDFRDDTFHNQWQSYRTRTEKQLQLQVAHDYEEPGDYQVVVKVIDILGNDSTKTITVNLR
jgi:adenine-specific DNA-methyltransferase